jgi:hypothetical protein
MSERSKCPTLLHLTEDRDLFRKTLGIAVQRATELAESCNRQIEWARSELATAEALVEAHKKDHRCE